MVGFGCTFDADGFEEWHPGGSCLPGTTLWNCLLCGEAAGGGAATKRAGLAGEVLSAELPRMVPPLLPAIQLSNFSDFEQILAFSRFQRLK